MPGSEQGLALGDAQRVHRDPGVEPQPRIGASGLGGKERADGAQQLGS